MIVRKILKYLLVAVLIFIGLILLLVVTTIAPVDRTPVTELDAYDEMKSELKTLDDSFSIQKPATQFSVGYSKVNLTPAYRTATDGRRKPRR